jgi:hypothetical protein
VGPIEEHLVSKEFPDSKEISLLIQLDRVISEWITWAIIRPGRRCQTNHNCHNRYKCCDMHIQNALASTLRACTDGSEAERDLSLYTPDTIRRHNSGKAQIAQAPRPAGVRRDGPRLATTQVGWQLQPERRLPA